MIHPHWWGYGPTLLVCYLSMLLSSLSVLVVLNPSNWQIILCADSSTDMMLQHFLRGERALLKTCPLVFFRTWPTVNHPPTHFWWKSQPTTGVVPKCLCKWESHNVPLKTVVVSSFASRRNWNACEGQEDGKKNMHCVSSTALCSRWCVYSSPTYKHTVKGFPFSLY